MKILIFRDVAEQISTAVLSPYDQARFSVPICSPGVPSLAPQGGSLWAAKVLHKDPLPFLNQELSVLWMPSCFNNPAAGWSCLSPSPFTGTQGWCCSDLFKATALLLLLCCCAWQMCCGWVPAALFHEQPHELWAVGTGGLKWVSAEAGPAQV